MTGVFQLTSACSHWEIPQKLMSQADRPWGGVHSSLLLQGNSLEQICVPGEICHKAAQAPDSSTTTLNPANTVPQLRTLANSTAQSRDEHKGKKDVTLGWFLAELWKLAKVACMLSIITQIITCLTSHHLWCRVCTQKVRRLIKSDPQSLNSNKLVSRPWPWQGWDTNRASPTQHPVQALDITIWIRPSIRGITASTVWGKTWETILKTDLAQNYWTHTVYILPHKNAPMRPWKTIVSPKFIKIEKIK